MFGMVKIRFCALLLASATLIGGQAGAVAANSSAFQSASIGEFMSDCVFKGGRVLHGTIGARKASALICNMPAGETRSCIYDDQSDSCHDEAGKKHVLLRGQGA
jgi:hypothetical protein